MKPSLVLLLLCVVACTCFAQALKIKTTVVNLEFTVVDQNGKNLTQFEKGDFVLYENKVRQDIGYFKQVDEPVAYSFVVDLSGSMGKEFTSLKKSITSFVQFAHPRDEYNLVLFDEGVEASYGLSGEQFVSKFLWRKPQKRTALWDAVNVGIDAVESTTKRKAVIVFTDGFDNFSRLGAGKVIRRIKESGIHTEVFAFSGEPPFYHVTETDPIRFQMEMQRIQNEIWSVKENLLEFATAGGGEVVAVDTKTDLDWEAAKLATQMRRSFTLGYVSTSEPDGKWRKIQLQLPGCSYCRVITRPGYFAK